MLTPKYTNADLISKYDHGVNGMKNLADKLFKTFHGYSE